MVLGGGVGPRATSVFDYPNAAGLFLGPLVMVMVGWLFGRLKSEIRNPKSETNHKYKIQNYLITLTIILSLVAIYFAKSEGAIAGIVIALLIAGGYFISVLLVKSEKLWRWGQIKLFIIVAIFLAYPLFALNLFPKYDYPDTGYPLMDNIFAKIELKDLSGEIRKQQWRETWQVLTESSQRFILGAGLANYQAAVAPYHQPGIFYNFDRDPKFRNELVFGPPEYKARHWQPVEIYMYPHSFILNFWVELGLVGVLLFVWVVYKAIASIFNDQYSIINQYPISNIKYLKYGLLAAFLVIIVHGMVDVPYFKNDLAVLFWVLLSLVGLLNLTSPQPSPSQGEGA